MRRSHQRRLCLPAHDDQRSDLDSAFDRLFPPAPRPVPLVVCRRRAPLLFLSTLPLSLDSLQRLSSARSSRCLFRARLLFSTSPSAGLSPADCTGNLLPSSDATMSKPNPIDHDGTVASRTRRQTRIRARDEDEQKQHTAQSSSHVSPAMRIYRHALESIFAMLELEDLSHALAVSCEWSAAVRSMTPIHVTLECIGCRSPMDPNAFGPLPPVANIVVSPLLRHLAAIHLSHSWDWATLNTASLHLLAQHAPNLTSLWCSLTVTPNEPLILPAKLQSLRLQLGSEYTDAAINGALTALAALPLLSRLSLRIAALDRESAAIELNRLAACSSLTDLKLDGVRGGPPKLSGAHWDQIRSSLGHLQSIDVGTMTAEKLARFLRPPVTARWRDIGFVYADARTGDLLLQLPLTRIDLAYYEDPVRLDCLPQLLLLTELNLHFNEDDEYARMSSKHGPFSRTRCWLLLCNAQASPR